MKIIAKSTLITAFALVATTGLTFAAKPKAPKPPKIDPVEEFLKQNDKNKDGYIDQKESHMGPEAFAKADKNHDGKLDKAELKEHLNPGKKKK